MLLTKSWIYGKLKVDTGILSVISDEDHITDAYPETVTVFPLIIYIDDAQNDMEYADNEAKMSAQRFIVHVFSKIDLATTSAIAVQVCLFFAALNFHCGSNGEVPDPVEGVRHRVLRFNRELFPSDIV